MKFSNRIRPIIAIGLSATLFLVSTFAKPALTISSESVPLEETKVEPPPSPPAEEKQPEKQSEDPKPQTPKPAESAPEEPAVDSKPDDFEKNPETPSQPSEESLPFSEDPPTVIESDHLKMTTLEEETKFIFSDNVSITTTDMTVFCDLLEVFAGRLDDSRQSEEKKTDQEKPKSETKSEDELGRIQRIIATGNVRVLQGDREATSGRAEVFPREGKVVLTENPVLRNEDGKVSGARITFVQGEGRAIVESDISQRPRVELRSIPAIGSGEAFRNDDAERN